MEAPYSKPSNIENPGPGKYDHEQKKNDIKSKIINEETVKVPFNSSEVRDINKKVDKQQVPGPG